MRIFNPKDETETETDRERQRGTVHDFSVFKDLEITYIPFLCQNSQLFSCILVPCAVFLSVLGRDDLHEAYVVSKTADWHAAAG